MGLGRMTKRKGFMHSIEGMFAASLIFFYAIQLFQSMSIERLDWVDASAKQEMQEFLVAVKKSDMKNMVYQGDFSNFVAVTRHFLGESRGYSLQITNLPKQLFEAGVLTINTSTVDATLNLGPCPAPTEYFCYESTFQGIDYVLIDYEPGVPNEIEEYDAIYFDLDSSGWYDLTEGPFVEGSIVPLGGTYWSIGDIHNNSGNVSFWEAGKLVEIMQHMSDFAINGRQTNVSFRATAISDSLDRFDTVIIPAEIDDLTAYESTILDYMEQGGGVIRLKNITGPADINNAEQNILAISWVSYDVFGTGSDGVFAEVYAGERAHLAEKYFRFSGISINIPSTNTAGYFTDDIPNNETARIGQAILGKEEYAVLVLKAPASSIYNVIRIDTDRDNNFTEETALYQGDEITVGENIYTVKEIPAKGKYIVLRPSDNHEFTEILESFGKVYPIEGLNNYVFARSKTMGYNTTTRIVGSITSTPAAACIAGESTMPVGEHRCGSFYVGEEYNYSITNTSTNYKIINIDFDKNGNYGDTAEGPYMNGAFITFGPEMYKAIIDPLGSNVKWTLLDRWRVPYATAHYIGEGAAIWMPDNQVSDDEWGLLEAALIASGKNSFEIAKGVAHGLWVISSSVFFEDKETYQPYGVTLKMWY